MKLRCLAVDDEPYALQQIAGYIRKTSFLELAGKCKNAFEAMELMSQTPVDLIFLDINMPELSGMEMMKSLGNETGVIFTTAYSEYAVESYRVNAIDYLLKPITYNNFLEAAMKAAKVLSKKQGLKTQQEKDYFFLRSEGKEIRINFSDIEYIESLGEYVKIHRTEMRPVMSLMRLKNIEKLVSKNRFMRVHRSYIVNLEKIETVERNRIIFGGKVYIPVSEQYMELLRDFLDGNVK